MGLDGVELVLAVEKEFGVTITDSDAAGIRTVGELHDLLRRRVAARDAAGCIMLPAFLEARRRTRAFCHDEGLRIRPSTRIDAVISASARRPYWKMLKDHTGAHPPPLQRPLIVQRGLWALAVLWGLLGLSTAWIDPAILPLGLLGAVFMMVLGAVLTSSLRVSPPAELGTFGDVARYLAGGAAATAADVQLTEVEDRVRQIVVDTLGVDPDEVVPEARFVDDLDMG